MPLSRITDRSFDQADFRIRQVIDKHQVEIFYTALTTVRDLVRVGDDPVKAISRKSLRRLGSVG